MRSDYPGVKFIAGGLFNGLSVELECPFIALPISAAEPIAKHPTLGSTSTSVSSTRIKNLTPNIVVRTSSLLRVKGMDSLQDDVPTTSYRLTCARPSGPLSERLRIGR